MASRAPKHRGPRGGDADTRSDILRAALQIFEERGYEGTSIRAIAREAGVDPSLPRHYFESKSCLFVEALGPVEEIEDRVAQIATGPRDQLGARMVGGFLYVWDSPKTGPRMKTLLGSAAAAPEVAMVAKSLLFENLLLPIARAIGEEDAEARAAAAMSQMMGLAVTRYVLKVEPIASASPEWMIARFGPTLQRHITGAKE